MTAVFTSYYISRRDCTWSHRSSIYTIDLALSGKNLTALINATVATTFPITPPPPPPFPLAHHYHHPYSHHCNHDSPTTTPNGTEAPSQPPVILTQQSVAPPSCPPILQFNTIHHPSFPCTFTTKHYYSHSHYPLTLFLPSL